MHQHSRLVSVLNHLNDPISDNGRDSITGEITVERLEKNLQRIFGNMKIPKGLELSYCNAQEDTGEPNDRFVNLSRNLQSDKSMGYNNFKQASRSRTESSRTASRNRIAKQDPQGLDILLDPKILLGVAATGLATALLPSSSPVSRSIISRVWPHLIQLAIAYLVYIRKQQDERGNMERSNTVLYIATALIQFFTAIRDFQGHTIGSFTRRAALGPLDPFMGLMKDIILGMPSFLFKTVFLSGVAIVGKVAIIGLVSVGIIAALGLLIVLAAENL